MTDPAKGFNPDEQDSSGFFNSLTHKAFEQLATTMLAQRLIQAALASFPKHFRELMQTEQGLQDLFREVSELWEDVKDG